MSVFVQAQGILKNCPRRRGVKKWQNSVHVVVERPLITFDTFLSPYFLHFQQRAEGGYNNRY